MIDDYANTNTQGVNTGGASAQPITAPFIASSAANAFQIAHIISSALQRPVRLVPQFGTPPYTLVTGVLPTNAITNCPSGTGY